MKEGTQIVGGCFVAMIPVVAWLNHIFTCFEEEM